MMDDDGTLEPGPLTQVPMVNIQPKIGACPTAAPPVSQILHLTIHYYTQYKYSTVYITLYTTVQYSCYSTTVL